MRRADGGGPVAAEIAVAQIVRRDQNDVRLRSGGASGKTANPENRGGDEQECSAHENHFHSIG